MIKVSLNAAKSWGCQTPLILCGKSGNGTPTPVFLPVESQGRGSLVGCRLWGHTESDTAEAT